jgi:hypothetical protein
VPFHAAAADVERLVTDLSDRETVVHASCHLAADENWRSVPTTTVRRDEQRAILRAVHWR